MPNLNIKHLSLIIIYNLLEQLLPKEERMSNGKFSTSECPRVEQREGMMQWPMTLLCHFLAAGRAGTAAFSGRAAVTTWSHQSAFMDSVMVLD